MSFTHKVVLWVMQRRGYLVTEQNAEFFFKLYLVCSKVDFCLANLTSEVIFFSEIVRVASSTNAFKVALSLTLGHLAETNFPP